MKNDGITLRQLMIRHSIAIKAVGVGLVTLIILLVGLFPLFGSANKTLKKIEVRQVEAETLANKVSILTQMDEAVLKERAKIIKQALPESKDVIAYLSAMDGLSKELGVSFGGITIAPGDISGDENKSSAKTKNSRKVSSLNVLDTDIKITGTSDGIYAFLRRVEQTLPLIQVSDVKVNKLGEDAYTMSLSLGMLWAPLQQSDLKGTITLFNEKEEEYFQKLNSFRVYTNNIAASESTETARQNNLFEP